MTYNILSRVHHRQNLPCFCGGYDEVRDNGNCLDFFRPGESPVVTDTKGRFGWSSTGVNATSWGRENLT